MSGCQYRNPDVGKPLKHRYKSHEARSHFLKWREVLLLNCKNYRRVAPQYLTVHMSTYEHIYSLNLNAF